MIDISENLNDAQACSEAESLADAILDYSFIVSVVFWYDILLCVNKISKALQREDADLSVAIEMLSSVVKWLTEYSGTSIIRTNWGKGVRIIENT